MTRVRDYVVAIGLLAILLALILWTNKKAGRTAVCPVCPPQNTVIAAAPQTPPESFTRDAFNPEDGSADGSPKDALADDAAISAPPAEQNNEPQTAVAQTRPRRFQRATVNGANFKTPYGEESASASGSGAAAAVDLPGAAIVAPQADLTETSASAAVPAINTPSYLSYNNKRLVVANNNISLFDSAGNEEVLFKHVRAACNCYDVINDTLFCNDAVGRVSAINLKTGKAERYKYKRSELCEIHAK